MGRHKKEIIPPTVGRIVWFFPEEGQTDSQFVPIRGEGPLAAIITKATSNTLINVTVFDSMGKSHGMCDVKLHHGGDDDPPPPELPYCRWMPYQLGQAAKTQALEEKLTQPHPANQNVDSE